ncbi:unnamed protein product [Rhizophagus irregularis]|uniref:BED-type domain-containing protein n=1 Tax=Rhizophagus irregularis TaxID=588596 RepID=A0A916E202_9GLOM|nr:unnamed protein product [Rhizophagus irregularis]
MSTQIFTFSNPSPNATPITPTKKKSKNSGGRPKSLVWGDHAIQGRKVSEGHYEATCVYCDLFWKKGSPQELEAHFANDSEGNMTNLSSKKRKLNDGSIQTKMSEFHESSQLSEDRIHEIDRACVKAFVVCGIPWRVIENPFFVEFLKTLRPGYTPPSKELLSGRLLSQETAVVNTRVMKDLKNTVNLTLCMLFIDLLMINDFNLILINLYFKSNKHVMGEQTQQMSQFGIF